MQIEPEIAERWETTGAAAIVGLYIQFRLRWVVLLRGHGRPHTGFEDSSGQGSVGSRCIRGAFEACVCEFPASLSTAKLHRFQPQLVICQDDEECAKLYLERISCNLLEANLS